MRRQATLFAPALVIALASGCGSGREVKVTGSIRANASLSNGGARTAYITEPMGQAPDALHATLKLAQEEHSFAATVAAPREVRLASNE